MSSIVGAALPWVGEKVSDLLGRQREASNNMVAGSSGKAGVVDADITTATAMRMGASSSARARAARAAASISRRATQLKNGSNNSNRSGSNSGCILPVRRVRKRANTSPVAGTSRHEANIDVAAGAAGRTNNDCAPQDKTPKGTSVWEPENFQGGGVNSNTTGVPKKRRSTDALAGSNVNGLPSPPPGNGNGAVSGKGLHWSGKSSNLTHSKDGDAAVAGGTRSLTSEDIVSGRSGVGVRVSAETRVGEGRARGPPSSTLDARVVLPAARSTRGGTTPSALGEGNAGIRKKRKSSREEEGQRDLGHLTPYDAGMDASEAESCPSSLTQQRAEEAGRRAQTERFLAPLPPVGAGGGGGGKADLTISNWPPRTDSVSATGDARVVSGSGGNGVGNGHRNGNSSKACWKTSSASYSNSLASSAPVLSNGVLASRPFSSTGSKGRSFDDGEEKSDSSDNGGGGTSGAARSLRAVLRGQDAASRDVQSSSCSSTNTHAKEDAERGVGVGGGAVSAAPEVAPRDGGRLAWCGDRGLLARPPATLQPRQHPFVRSSSLSYPVSAKGLASAAGRGAHVAGSSSACDALSGRCSQRQSTAAAAACLGRLDFTAVNVDAAGAAYPTGGGGGGADRRGDLAWGGGVANGGSTAGEGHGRGAGGITSGDREAGDGPESRTRESGEVRVMGVVEVGADDVATMSSSALSVTSREDEESDTEDVYMMVDDRYDPDYHPFAESLLDANSGDESSVDMSVSIGHDNHHNEDAGKAKKTRMRAQVAAGEAYPTREKTSSQATVLGDDSEECAGESSIAPNGSDCGTLAGGDSGGHLSVGEEAPMTRGGGRKKTLKSKAARRRDKASAKAEQCNDMDSKPEPRVAKPRTRTVVEPLVPPQPPPGPRQWPARPANRALVYVAAAQASRRARGFTGWSFPKLPPALVPPTPPLAIEKPKKEEVDVEEEAPGSEERGGIEEGSVVVAAGRGKKVRKCVESGKLHSFLGLAKDNPLGVPSPNELGWMSLGRMHTPEGRAAIKRQALEKKRRALEEIAQRKREELERRRLELERIAQRKRDELEKRRLELERVAYQKRQEILDALRIKEEIAEARRKRRLNVLFLGMTRVAEYDSRGGLTKGMKRFDLVERMVRDDVNEANMNPLRDTARVLAMEALGHEVRCISKVSTPGESDCENSRSTRAHGGPTGLGRFLATDITNTGASRGFLRKIEEKWEKITFDTVLLDHYWLPDSVVWLNKGYMANDGGLIQNLVRMTKTQLLGDDFEIMLPINQAFFELLLPHFSDLERHFTVEFLVGERLEHLKRSHLALEADDLIPEDVMQHVYGKEPERQVSRMLGVKQPTADVAAVLLKYGVAAEHFCYARFLKLSRNPPPHPALAAVALAASSESAKIAEDMAKVAAESAQMAAESAMAFEAAGLSGALSPTSVLPQQEARSATSGDGDEFHAAAVENEEGSSPRSRSSAGASCPPPSGSGGEDGGT
ncbi:hypothetical protein Esi_0050_0091 [Ectocarpus siliculosus]|uniref:Uncharacterized protein n=1 Tax=Ectocarpus siliculosus TaxID=2880 RepID=D7G392_ECTSI|nr:hypothetical protein Esi_0050_0091 [Ectocarpus siliculosus]|eukprot:CBJ26939.1 hypothetical protein Esi_0050_0091 [Ectocarpus siliculosus]